MPDWIDALAAALRWIKVELGQHATMPRHRRVDSRKRMLYFAPCLLYISNKENRQ